MKRLKLKNLKRDIRLSRDKAGVPHVDAANWLDALYGLGYMQASDRGTQMLFARSIASGRAAEEIRDSPELVETDRLFRRVALYRRLAEEFSLLPEEIRQQLTAFCAGVNDCLEASWRSIAMLATGYRPQPWRETSVLLVGQLLSFGGLAVSQMQNERVLLEIIHAGIDEQAMKELFEPRLDTVDFEMLRQVRIASQLSDEALEVLTDLPRLAGSNAWAVSSGRSRSGGALLASDPHLEINRLPAIWYEAVLRWNGQYVMGATLPGCPLFAVARTNRLAWGVTYMKGDTVDYFVEDCRTGGECGWQSRRAAQWHDFRLREEVIHRKGAEPETMPVYENDQGVLDGDPAELGAGYQLSVAWSGSFPGSGRAIGTWLEVVGSEDVRQAMEAVRPCPQPTLSWVFADRNGHIGQQCCGRFPKRGGGYNGLTPIPAWDPQNHWQGWLSHDVLPRIYDPPSGFVATANEEQNPSGGPLLVTQTIHDYRKRRIEERLAEMPQATVEDMQQLQYDLYSMQARELLELFLPCMPDGEIKDRLAAWDLRFAPESCEATLFQKLYRNVMVEIFGHEKGIGWRRMVYLVSRIGFSVMVLTAADRLLKKDQSCWWRTRSKEEMIRRAAQRLIDDPEVPWSEVNNFHFADRFFGAHQVGRLFGFKSRQYPMPGNFSTPFQGHVLQTARRESTFAPSYHFVADMSTEKAWTNLPGGPKESRFSRYYNNDIPNWLAGTYKQLSAFEETANEETSPNE